MKQVEIVGKTIQEGMKLTLTEPRLECDGKKIETVDTQDCIDCIRSELCREILKLLKEGAFVDALFINDISSWR